MSERYINNLTGDFSICFSEHLTEHPSKQIKTNFFGWSLGIESLLRDHLFLWFTECDNSAFFCTSVIGVWRFSDYYHYLRSCKRIEWWMFFLHPVKMVWLCHGRIAFDQTLKQLKPKSVIRACLDFVLLEEWILFGF